MNTRWLLSSLLWAMLGITAIMGALMGAVFLVASFPATSFLAYAARLVSGGLTLFAIGWWVGVGSLVRSARSWDRRHSDGHFR